MKQYGLNLEDNKAGDSRLVSVSGSVASIIYQNEQNGYTVFEIESEKDGTVTAVGSIPYLAEGEEITVTGSWTHHPEYGRQLKADSYEKRLPATESAILRYLSSGAIKGVGPITASRIVSAFGKDTFEVLENHPEWLCDVHGITRKKAAEISSLFREQAGVRSVMLFTRDFFGPAAAVKVYKLWGASAVDMIKKNPYRLCEEIRGIGFETADKIAASLGRTAGDSERLKSGIKYVLIYNAAQNGHTCMPRERLCEACVTLLGVDAAALDEPMKNLIITGEIKSSIIENREYIFTKENYASEVVLAEKLYVIDGRAERLGTDNVERMIHTLEYESGITYAALQRKAIFEAFSSGVMILTGGPGTGKTTIVRALISIFDSMQMKTALAAPTGRAAKRMSEATGREAKTIHRLLEMDYREEEQARFCRDEHNFLDEDAIVIDEASMLDLSLAESLVRAVRPGARLILIGDADQLPSVGAGNVLRDIIDSGGFNTVCLREVFRQAEESLIVTNAHKINGGEIPDTTRTDSDFFFLPRGDDETIASTIVDLCVNRLPKSYGASAAEGIQVISPSRKGRAGTERLNILLQAAENPPAHGKAEKKIRDVVFREGDRVMQIKNDYNLEWEKDGADGIGIFNGDIGRIERIDVNRECLHIDFDGRRVKYDYAFLDELEHAYAVTVHKSQGSEYPTVILPLYGCAEMLRTRNLLYTAVTRAKERMILVGRRDILETMVNNNRQVNRYTALSHRIKEVVK